jgi:two-component system chemotaxis sensor kinase CheA
MQHSSSINKKRSSLLQQQNTILQDHDVLENVLQLNTLLTNTLDLETLTMTFLAKSLSLLHLQVAALYLYDAEKKCLCLSGAQGFDFQELNQEFALGEGLVGNTAKNRTISYIQQPQREEARPFCIKTIQGNVLPAYLYQLPLVQGNELLGVLTVGSIYPMSEKARNTLNVVSTNFATVISHAKAYERIRVQAEVLEAKSHEQEQANIALRIQRDELHTLNMALEKANQVRNQFLTTMAHELRTPLTAILGFSQVLLRDTENSEVRKRTTIERILKNGRHLLDIMNDALDLVKIEAGQMSVRISSVSLPDVIADVTKEAQALATTKMLHLQVDIAPDIPEISSDVAMLQQILFNLISNAIKFTEQGKVSISAKKLSGEGIALCIQDSGIGIAPEIQERIFDAFYQGDNSITRRYGGTGLGLSIVRHLTYLLGGTITLESSPGQGSTFTLFLPQESNNSNNVYTPERENVNRGHLLESKKGVYSSISS